MTKEQIGQEWDTTAREVCTKRNITGGTVDKGWNQEVCGTITAISTLKLRKRFVKDEEYIPALIACCTYGANASQRGQSLFSAKTVKSTELAATALDLVKSLVK